MNLFVAQSWLHGAIARYAESFNALELHAEPGVLPRLATLRRWRADVSEGFAFSLRVPVAVAGLSLAWERALEPAAESAEALRAAWWVVPTPPSVAPSARTRRSLSALFERLRAEPGRRIGWEPHGVWERAEAHAWAADLGVTLIVDAARTDPEPAPVIYTRLLALGTQATVRRSALERVVDRVAGADEAWVVMEGRGAAQGARWLRAELLGTEPAPLGA